MHRKGAALCELWALCRFDITRNDSALHASQQQTQAAQELGLVSVECRMECTISLYVNVQSATFTQAGNNRQQVRNSTSPFILASCHVA